nr:MAG TPA: hypothetical protein [Bacteriophage sp.]
MSHGGFHTRARRILTASIRPPDRTRTIWTRR